MAETAAWLVDRVIPKVPVGQWVLSFPIPLRSLFAVHPELLAPVSQIIHRVIATHLIKQAGIKRSEAATGAVTLIQRFGSAANLNIPLHGLVLDGVYHTGAEGAPVFRPAPALTGEELQALLGKSITRVLRLLTREGHLVEEEGVTYVRTRTESLIRKTCSHRCKRPPAPTASRPAIANERLSVNHAGQVVLKLKTLYRDGTSHINMSPLEFMQRLAALVPRPRLHLIRFHGALAPHAKLRAAIVPIPAQTAHAADGAHAHGARSRMGWARLLKRVFNLDVERCGQCGGKMRIIAAIEAPAVIERILTHLGLSAQPPLRAPARRVELFQAA